MRHTFALKLVKRRTVLDQQDVTSIRKWVAIESSGRAPTRASKTVGNLEGKR